LLLVACGDGEAEPRWLDDGPRPGCVDGARETQRRGTACLCCHASEFGVAGSIDPDGPPVARVVVSDGHGNVADMVPNGFGNFFRHLQLTPPLTATLYGADGRALTMQTPAESADCNSCHGAGRSAPPLRGPVP
jgi:hypothetical protein